MKPSPLLTIRQARAIGAISEHASLAKAAEHVSSSQSSLSRVIAEAERSLGRRLFQRGWAGMEPTSQGDIVISHCRRMMAHIQGTQTELSRRGARVGDLSYHLNWSLLGAAEAVCTMRSVSAAANYLGRSQPDVSRALAKLSAAVGRPLFRRIYGGMAATDDAAVLTQLYYNLLSDVMMLPERLRAILGEMTGRVAVGLLPFSEQDIVVKAFGVILRRHRHVRLQAVTGSYPALIDGLRKGELDFVLGPLRMPAPEKSLEEMRLFDESFAIVARKGHRLARSQPTLSDLVGENWVVAPHGTPTRAYFEDVLMRQGLTPPSQTCEIVTFFLAEQMITHSDAIGLLTYSARKRRSLRDGLEILPVRLPDSRRPIGITFRKHPPLAPAQKAFLTILNGEKKKLGKR